MAIALQISEGAEVNKNVIFMIFDKLHKFKRLRVYWTFPWMICPVLWLRSLH